MRSLRRVAFTRARGGRLVGLAQRRDRPHRRRVGMVILSTAVARSGPAGKQTVLGKLHTYVRPASISPLHTLETVSKCPPGSVAITGGIDFDTGSPNVLVPWNGPLVGTKNLVDAGPGRFGPPTAWRARVIDLSLTQGYSYAVGVVCASLEQN